MCVSVRSPFPKAQAPRPHLPLLDPLLSPPVLSPFTGAASSWGTSRAPRAAAACHQGSSPGLFRRRPDPRGCCTRPQPPSGCWCCRPLAPRPLCCPRLRPWRPLPLRQAGPQNLDLPPPQDLPRPHPLRDPTITCSLTPRVSHTPCWWTRRLRGSPGLMGFHLRKSATAALCAPGSSSTCRISSDTASPTRR